MNNIHTFVICAYKKSPYLEECIISLKKQTISSKIVLATSTPSEWLKKICDQYQIPYFVRNGQSNISIDWEFALSVTDTEYVTIAHQDDIYEPDYTENVIQMIKKNKQEPILILFCDYMELINGRKFYNRINLIIKRMLLKVLKNDKQQGKVWRKRWILRFGNAICCPSVTYHLPTINLYMKQDDRHQLFEKHFRSNVDWETWEWLSRKEGRFVYISKRLMAHRIHLDSETTATIKSNQRGREDYEMFNKFWPEWIAKLLTGLYQESEKGNVVS